jgi:hypothetical protein
MARKATRKTVNAPRDGSKQAKALKLLKKGATLAQLSKAVDQKPITVRSLIGALRTRGYPVRSLGEERFGL